jgi:hypothetical protein
MTFYQQLYYTLCESKKQTKELYVPFSGLHEHHILPKHSGGTDNTENLTYLTVREHIIAHFLLWKIYKNPNDLRAMKMLGVELTVQQRKQVGMFCVENKIGIHGYTKRERLIHSKKGLESQKQSGSKNTFYYWSTEEGRKERASMGGKASIISPNNPWSYWASNKGQIERSSLGGRAHKGKKTMYRPGDSTFIRVSPQDFDNHLQKGYIFGSPQTPKNKGKKTNVPSVRRRKITDGAVVYDSVVEAASRNGVTPATIINRCNSKKNFNWQYVSNTES